MGLAQNPTPYTLNPIPCTQVDDRAIKAEGLDSLTETELREACRARGMRCNVYGEGAPAALTKKLEQWLDLSLNRWALGHPGVLPAAADAAAARCFRCSSSTLPRPSNPEL